MDKLAQKFEGLKKKKKAKKERKAQTPKFPKKQGEPIPHISKHIVLDKVTLLIQRIQLILWMNAACVALPVKPHRLQIRGHQPTAINAVKWLGA